MPLMLRSRLMGSGKYAAYTVGWIADNDPGYLFKIMEDKEYSKYSWGTYSLEKVREWKEAGKPAKVKSEQEPEYNPEIDLDEVYDRRLTISK